MLARAVVVVSVVAGLCAPGTAFAQDPPPTCVRVPVDTVGAHVEVAGEEVHVPAISNAQLCAVVWPPVGESSPVEVTFYLHCGFPCFTVVVEQRDWTVVSTRVAAYLSYDADGVPTVVPLADVPIGVHLYNPNPVCVAVGNPIPECPPGSIAVPVPAPAA